MRMKIAAVLLALGISSPAFAQTTFLANPGSTTPFRFGTDGSGKLFGNGAICDGAACAAMASVNPAGTPGTNGLAIQGLTGGVPLPVTGTFFQATQPVSLASPVSVTPKTASFTITGCSVTTSSAQCLAGATAVNHVQIQNTSPSASIACNWGGTAVLNSAAGSFMLAASVSSLWGQSTSGIPSAALNCIGSAAATLYIEYN